MSSKLRCDAYIKRDIHISREIYTYQKRYTHIKRDIHISKEIYTDQKRYTHIKRDIHISKETFKRDQYLDVMANKVIDGQEDQRTINGKQAQVEPISPPVTPSDIFQNLKLKLVGLFSPKRDKRDPRA